jgi:hypothetical protein
VNSTSRSKLAITGPEQLANPSFDTDAHVLPCASCTRLVRRSTPADTRGFRAAVVSLFEKACGGNKSFPGMPVLENNLPAAGIDLVLAVQLSSGRTSALDFINLLGVDGVRGGDRVVYSWPSLLVTFVTRRRRSGLSCSDSEPSRRGCLRTCY